MATGDIYQLIDKSRIFSNDAFNVWYVRSVDAATDAEELAQEYVLNSLPDILSFQSPDLNHYEIECRNLFNADDYAQLGIDIDGTFPAVGVSMPIHDAIGCQLVHNRASIRTGSKRFAGIGEGVSEQYGIVNASYMTTVDTALNGFVDAGVARDLGGSLFETIGEFVVVKVIPEVIGGVTGYRLPENLAEAVWGVISEVIVKPNYTTQTSRKIGKGS